MLADSPPLPSLPDSIPISTLARADELVRRTAFLAGMVAPETAACLSELLEVTNTHYSSVIDGCPSEPKVLERASIPENQHYTLRVSILPSYAAKKTSDGDDDFEPVGTADWS